MIMNVFLDGVAMMIAICLVVVTSVFVFWGMTTVGHLVWPFVRDVGRCLVEMMGIKPPLTPLTRVRLTWCQGCDELVKSERMAFIDGWRYRCDACRRSNRQFVMDVSTVEDVKAGRQVLTVHNGGQVSVIKTWRRAADRHALDAAIRSAAAPMLVREAQKVHQRWVDWGDDENR